ncbi:MAG: hypothetical protein BWY27_00013 [Bacteroidetes bacterium ADurb.Bin234]|nr:MAG: hypothetical protein BWY27_00013 [Bacteroidetes bacterium ADurb.Bin234]
MYLALFKSKATPEEAPIVTLSALPFKEVNVTVFVAFVLKKVPLIELNELYVPEANRKTTGPDTPQLVKAVMASFKVEKSLFPPPTS